MVTVDKVGNRKHYQANPTSPVFDELTSLVRKTVGLRAPLQAALAPFQARVAAAFVYGSIAKDTENADIDLMVIADELDYSELFGAMPFAQAILARPVNPNLMTRKEWKGKRAASDSLAARIKSQPKLFIIGNEDHLD